MVASSIFSHSAYVSSYITHEISASPLPFFIIIDNLSLAWLFSCTLSKFHLSLRMQHGIFCKQVYISECIVQNYLESTHNNDKMTKYVSVLPARDSTMDL